MLAVLVRPNFPISVLMMVLFPSFAHAHPDFMTMGGFGVGLLHPLTGVDHLLAMFAVGVWAARLGRPSLWMLPAVFALAMISGATLGAFGLALPMIEPMIAISVVVLGLMVASGWQASAGVSAVIVGVFAIFHGHAHALEAPAAAGFLGYGSGFVAGTMLLHLAGLAVGRSMAARERVMALGGSAIAAIGIAILAG